MDNKIKLGKNIKALRDSLGLSQDELADRVHVTSQAVSKWELGETAPSIETLYALSQTFCTSIDNLLSNVDVEENESGASNIDFKLRKVYLSFKRKESVNSQIKDIVSIILPLYSYEKDYFWIYSARMLLKGTIVAMLEDKELNENTFNLTTIKKILQLDNLDKEEAYKKIKEYFETKSTKAKELVNSYISSPQSTGESIRTMITTYINLLVW